MNLKNTIIAIDIYQGNTKFSFWTNIQKDDELEISMQFKKTIGGSNGHYAPLLRIKNLRSMECFKDTLNSLYNYLDKLPFVEKKDVKTQNQ